MLPITSHLFSSGSYRSMVFPISEPIQPPTETQRDDQLILATEHVTGSHRMNSTNRQTERHVSKISAFKMVMWCHLPSAYRAPWQGQTPTPQRGKFSDATAAHCLVTGSYRSVQSKIMESFSPGAEKKGFLVRLKMDDTILLLHKRKTTSSLSPPTT